MQWGSGIGIGILLAVLDDAFLLGGCSEGWIANAFARLRRARRLRYLCQSSWTPIVESEV
jgi:hypothetical protein